MNPHRFYSMVYNIDFLNPFTHLIGKYDLKHEFDEY